MFCHRSIYSTVCYSGFVWEIIKFTSSMDTAQPQHVTSQIWERNLCIGWYLHIALTNMPSFMQVFCCHLNWSVLFWQCVRIVKSGVQAGIIGTYRISTFMSQKLARKLPIAWGRYDEQDLILSSAWQRTEPNWYPQWGNYSRDLQFAICRKKLLSYQGLTALGVTYMDRKLPMKLWRVNALHDGYRRKV